MIPGITEKERAALELALAKYAAKQGLVPVDVWAQLAQQGIVRRALAVAWFDEEGNAVHESPERSWYEMTPLGCRVLGDHLGAPYHCRTCWRCAEESPFPADDISTVCPTCGAYSADE
jgi:hypothetical protein